MAIILQLHGGPNANVVAYTGSPRELVVDTDNWQLRLQDGSTVGGHLIGGGISTVPVPVNQGGSGAATLGAHGILLGEGTSPITSLVSSAANQLFVGAGGTADPSWEALTTFLDAATLSTAGSLLSRDGTSWAARALTTYTPALTFGGASTGITYATQTGFYLAIGAVTFAMFNLVLTAKGTATGAAAISLPSTSAASKLGGGLATTYSNLASVTLGPRLQVTASSGVASIVVPGTNTTTALTDANFTATSTFGGILLYLNV